MHSAVRGPATACTCRPSSSQRACQWPARSWWIERNESQPPGRGSIAGEHRACDRGEILCRLPVALADGDQLAVKRGFGRNVVEGSDYRSEPVGQIRAVARPPTHLAVGTDIEKK